jgi:hypothetical protein
MALHKLAVAPVIAVLALAAPVAVASAQPSPGSPESQIPCYPYPAFCGPNGQPFNPFFSFQTSGQTAQPLGLGPVQVPGITVP